MHQERLKSDETDVPILAVGVCRTHRGNMHTGIAHRRDGQLYFYHQAWHHRTEELEAATASATIGTLHFAIPIAEEERLQAIAGLCRLIARVGQQHAYALLHDTEAFFDGTLGTLAMPNGKGLNCSTFVLVIFQSARYPLIRFDGWPNRAEDAEMHQKLIDWLTSELGAHSEHVAAVQNEKGCVRARPEEVAGACLYSPLPTGYAEASTGGAFVLGIVTAAP